MHDAQEEPQELTSPNYLYLYAGNVANVPIICSQYCMVHVLLVRVCILYVQYIARRPGGRLRVDTVAAAMAMPIESTRSY